MYTPSNWKTGDIITADKLNNLENGVDSLQTQVDNSAVGTNLLAGTAKCVFPFHNNGVTGTVQKYDDGTNYIQCASNTPIHLIGIWWRWTPEVGQVYTLSADICGNGHTGGSMFHYEGASDDGTLGGVDLTDNWQRVSSTFRVNTTGSNWNIYALNSSLLKIKNIKIEKGSVATPWSPNPTEILTQGDYAKIKSAIVALGGSLS